MRHGLRHVTRPGFAIVGHNGVNLQDQWRDDTVTYLGMTSPGMPNL